MIKVLLVGPSVTRTKGGMATVINDVVKTNENGKVVKFKHVVSHVEGSKLEKAFVAVKALIEVLMAADFKIIHIHSASDASFYRKSLFVFLGKVLQKKVIFHMHGADFDSFYENSPAMAKWYIRKTFSLCDKILVLSDFWKSFFVKNITNQQVEVLLNGVYSSEFESSFTTPENISKFLFLGRLGHRKGVYDLLKVADVIVNERQYKDIYFYLAGDGDIEEVREIVEAKGLQQHVQIMGWIGEKEKLECLKQADTMVLPSYNEGLPMSILEAMAAGKIIISSRVGGIPDLVTEQENGFLIDPGDVESLCRHIMHVVSNPAEMEVISRNNIFKIKEQYDLPKIHAQLFEMYYSLLNKKLENTNSEPAYKYQAVQPLD